MSYVIVLMYFKNYEWGILVKINFKIFIKDFMIKIFKMRSFVLKFLLFCFNIFLCMSCFL